MEQSFIHIKALFLLGRCKHYQGPSRTYFHKTHGKCLSSNVLVVEELRFDLMMASERWLWWQVFIRSRDVPSEGSSVDGLVMMSEFGLAFLSASCLTCGWFLQLLWPASSTHFWAMGQQSWTLRTGSWTNPFLSREAPFGYSSWSDEKCAHTHSLPLSQMRGRAWMFAGWVQYKTEQFEMRVRRKKPHCFLAASKAEADFG